MEAKNTPSGIELCVGGVFVAEITSLQDWQIVKSQLSDSLIGLAWPFVKQFQVVPNDWKVTDGKVGLAVSAPGCKPTWEWPPHQFYEYCCTRLDCWKTQPFGTFVCREGALFQNQDCIARIQGEHVSLVVRDYLNQLREVRLPRESQLLEQLLRHKSVSLYPAVSVFRLQVENVKANI